MKAFLAVSAALTLGTIRVASAEAPRGTYRWTDPSKIGGNWTAPEPSTVSHIIFLNKCQGGCTLHPGNNNSTTDTSSIVNGTSVVSQYSGTAAQWTQIVNCVKATYAPFNVTITDVRPTSGDYHMAIVAGHASDVGEGQGVLGVSPFSCGYIPNSISFSFANEEPTNIDDICWTVSQETAHSWGLDHKYDNRDPMTYLSTGPTMKTFQNQAGSCGEYSARACQCQYEGSTSSMNSYKEIMNTFGSSAPDTVPPTVMINTPTNGSVVNPGFGVTATLNDDRAVDHAELKIDGASVGTLTAAPWAWNAPSSLTGTSHTVEVDAYDSAGNKGTATVMVSFPVGCMHDTDCDSGQVCSNSQCVAGPGMQGGLGSTCAGNSDCASGQCADDGAGHMYCVSTCDPTASTCPSNFSCIDTGGGNGVCWPGGSDNGGGKGGCDAGGNNGAVLLGLGFAAMLVTRRRKR